MSVINILNEGGKPLLWTFCNEKFCLIFIKQNNNVCHKIHFIIVAGSLWCKTYWSNTTWKPRCKNLPSKTDHLISAEFYLARFDLKINIKLGLPIPTKSFKFEYPKHNLVFMVTFTTKYELCRAKSHSNHENPRGTGAILTRVELDADTWGTWHRDLNINPPGAEI